MLEIKKLSYGYKSHTNELLVNNLNFSVDKGKIQLVFGKSGYGKSTLLNLISGFKLENLIWKGEILIEKKNIMRQAPEIRQIGFLMQERFLFPHLSVFENLYFAIPKYINNKKQLIHDYIEENSLTNILEFYPYQLSGGQSTRIACIRTLLSFPKVILMDEPFSSLDEITKTQFRKFVKTKLNFLNIPCILVTHDSQDKKISDNEVINLKKYI